MMKAISALILTLSISSGMSVAYAVADTTDDQVTYNLTQEHIESVYGEAINRWVEAGVDRKRFDNVRIDIANLKGSTIGYGGYNHITFDHNGAGAGWFIDLTPDEDEEYYIKNGRQYARKNTGAEGHIDLLSVVTHELGHHLGYGHSNSGVMQPRCPVGQRTLKIQSVE